MKTALVTGAARGIGRAIAENLARDHHIAFTWHSFPADGICSALPDALGVQCDLTTPDVPEQVIDQVMDRFGALDLIVNNAGGVVATPHDAVDPDAHAKLYALHVTAPAGLLAAALPHLKPGAAVVNISSTNAILPPMGAAIYGASKAAQNLWTRGMAKELGPQGIRVNAVAPGAVNTPENDRDPALTAKFLEMTALDQLATTDDIAAAVRFLATDAAKSITGHILDVNAGYRL